MSILKAFRNEPKPKFHVLDHAIEIRSRIEEELLPAVKLLPEFEDDEYAKELLVESRRGIIIHLRWLVGNITAANSVYPPKKKDWPEVFRQEMTERRMYQDRAIGNCYQVIQEMQHIASLKKAKLDLNRCLPHIDGLKFQTAIIRKWRYSDNKIWKEFIG